MAIEVDFVMERVASLLKDVAHDRWTIQNLTDYLNEAQIAICKRAPAANVTTTDVTLVEGTKQTLPADGTLLLSVVRNVVGGSPGAGIRWVDMDVQTATNPNWHTDTPDNTVLEYMYEMNDPYTFWVYPPQTNTPGDVTIRYAAVPANINVGDNLSLGDEYLNAVIEFMLYRAYSLDAEYSGEEGRADAHLKNFEKEVASI